MVKYYWQFDICAAVVSAFVLLEMWRGKDIRQTKNRWFLWLSLAIFVSSLADLPGIYMQNHPESFQLQIADISTMLFLTIRNMLPWLYVCYIVRLLRLTLRYRRTTMGVIMLPQLLMILCMLIEPTRRFVYRYVDGRIYQRGPLFPVFYLLTAYYVIMGLVMVVRYRRAMDRKLRVAVYWFTFLSVVPVVVQSIFPALKFALFFQSVGLLGGFTVIENEDSIRSPQSGLYNRYALIRDAKLFFDVRIDSYVISVKTPSLQTMAMALGRANADYINLKIGQFIRGIIPAEWLLYDYGPSEFAVIACGVKKEALEKVVDVLRKRFSESWDYASGRISFPAEILITQIPEKASSLEQLLMILDAPCDPRLTETRVLYPDETANQQREAKVLLALREALRTRSLMVWFQPIFDSSLGSAWMAEALLRLKEPELGMISPEFFIPLAEKNGLIGEIGDFVFEETCNFLSRCRAEKSSLRRVEINLSASQCMDQALPERWEKIMRRYGITADRLGLEMTESQMLSTRFEMNRVILRLREMGFSFALDDYGTGYSNDAYVMSIPFELIKIDKSILWGADKDSRIDKMLHHTIAMFRDMNIKVVVEGVETPGQREKLEQAGADFLQGFLFAKPLPEEATMGYFRV